LARVAGLVRAARGKREGGKEKLQPLRDVSTIRVVD
jgi:hypothetical protein